MQQVFFGIFFIFPLVSISQPKPSQGLTEISLSPRSRVQIITEKLNDLNTIVLLEALHNLQSEYLNHPIIQKKLIELLYNKTAIIRLEVIKIIQSNKLNSLTFQQELTKALFDSNSIVQLAAANTLEKFQPNHFAIHRQLAKALSTPDLILRLAVLKALTASKPNDSIVLKRLTETLDDLDDSIRLEALRVLRFNGLNDPIIQRKIVNLLYDPSDQVRLETIIILEKIQLPMEAFIFQILADTLADSNAYIGLAAASILKKMILAARTAEENIPNEFIIQKKLSESVNNLDSKIQKVAIQILDHLKAQSHKINSCPGVFK